MPMRIASDSSHSRSFSKDLFFSKNTTQKKKNVGSLYLFFLERGRPSLPQISPRREWPAPNRCRYRPPNWPHLRHSRPQPDRTPSIRGPETARSPQWCRRAALRVTSRRRACDSARQLSSSSQSRYCVELLASPPHRVPHKVSGMPPAPPKTWDFISEHGVWSFLPDPRAMRQ